MMPCPVCRGFLVFSYIEDSADHHTVYRCTRCTSSDERLFIMFEGRLVEVRPRKVAGEGKNAHTKWYIVAMEDIELKAREAAAAQRRRFARREELEQLASLIAPSQRPKYTFVRDACDESGHYMPIAMLGRLATTCFCGNTGIAANV